MSRVEKQRLRRKGGSRGGRGGRGARGGRREGEDRGGEWDSCTRVGSVKVLLQDIEWRLRSSLQITNEKR